MSKTKSKREYVVGYKGDNQCVYGPDGIVTTSCTRWVDRMTTETAKRRAGRLLSPDVDVCIYRLVPVATGRAVNGEFVERKKAKKKAAPRAKSDEPRIVRAPNREYDIRTKTHYWVQSVKRWVPRDSEMDTIGLYSHSECVSMIPAARAAWRKLQAEGKVG